MAIEANPYDTAANKLEKELVSASARISMTLINGENEIQSSKTRQRRVYMTAREDESERSDEMEKKGIVGGLEEK